MSGLQRSRSAAALLFLLAVACNAAFAQHTFAQHDHHFRDAERWAQVFDNPERDAWQRPDEVIAALKLPADAIVADVGAGTGYFAVRLARAVPQGRVYAVDLEPEMVTHLEQRAKEEELTHLHAVLAMPDDAQLPEPVDAVLLVNTYHHIGERTAYFRALAKSIKPDGRLAVIDFRMDSPIGPPRSGRIDAQQAITELGAAGYRVVERHDFLPHQYFVVLQPLTGATP